MERTRKIEVLTDELTLKDFGQYKIIPSPLFVAGHKSISMPYLMIKVLTIC